MQEAFGLEVGPEFELVDRKRVHVIGAVPRGLRVEAFAAGAFDDLAELVGDDIFVRFGDGVFPHLLQLRDFLIVATDTFLALVDVGGIGLFHLFKSDFFGCPIGGADGRRAFKSHVLEHVREAGASARVLRRAGVYDRIEGEDGSFMALADDKGEAVGQGLDGDALFERCHVLRGEKSREQKEREGKLRGEAFHRTSKSQNSRVRVGEGECQFGGWFNAGLNSRSHVATLLWMTTRESGVRGEWFVGSPPAEQQIPRRYAPLDDNKRVCCGYERLDANARLATE